MQVGDDLYVMMLEPTNLREQDVNAQVMSARHFERLTENIRNRGALESLPYIYWPNRQGVPEIVSGHHRVRAGRAAGLKEIPCLVDTREMRRTELIAKQIAHNELHGSPDEQILGQLVAMIDNVDDLLTTGLPDDWLPIVGTEDTQLGLPHADFSWHVVTMLFLSRQMDDFKTAIDSIDPRAEIVGLADQDQFEEFAKRVIDYSRAYNVRSVAAAVAVICKVARQQVEAARAAEGSCCEGCGQVIPKPA